MSKVKLVVWDLDNTIWKGILAEGEVVPDKRIIDIIKQMNSRGIVNSICSKNEYNLAKNKLVEMGIWNLFVFSVIDFVPKGEAVFSIIREMSLRDENVLFVDDNVGNRNEVKYYNHSIRVLDPKDITEDLLLKKEFEGYLEGESKIDQYRQLEKKVDKKKEYLDNYEFLHASHIRVTLIDYEEKYYYRVEELLEKTNQLNFTKNRMGGTELKKLLKNKGIETMLVKVEDDFGDYGVVGIWSIEGRKLIHFTFSCRIMNMGVEQYLYSYLGYPQIDVVGEVASNLKSHVPDWITIFEKNRESKDLDFIKEASVEKIISDRNHINIFGMGACDLLHSMSYFGGMGITITYECNEFKGIERGVNTGTEYLRSIYDMTDDLKNYCRSHFYNYLNAFNGSKIFDNSNDVIILSFHDDMVFKVFSNKSDRNLRVIRTSNPAYGLTSIIENENIISHDDEEKWLIKNGFDEGFFISPERFRDNLLWISEMTHNKNIFLITGPEYPYFRDYMRECVEVRNQIIKLNGVIREVCNEFSDRFALIDINEIVKTRNDFTDYVFHLSAQASYELYCKIIHSIAERKKFTTRSYLNGITKNKKIIIIGDGISAKSVEAKLKLYNERVSRIVDYDTFIRMKDVFDKGEYYYVIMSDTKLKYNDLLKMKRAPIEDFIYCGGVEKTESVSFENCNNNEISIYSTDTWSKCKNTLRSDGFIVWGIGRGNGIRRVDKELGLSLLKGAIDINPCLHGVDVGVFLSDENHNPNEIKVESPQKFGNIIGDDMVVLVTGMKASNEIRKSIDNHFGKVKHVFSVYDMDQNRRNGNE